jgi:hypothetical protein
MSQGAFPLGELEPDHKDQGETCQFSENLRQHPISYTHVVWAGCAG